MSPSSPIADDFLAIGPRIRVLPIVHGSGDFAIVAREEILSRPYDCLAVPLPPSFQDDVEAAVERLPVVSAVLQPDVGGDSDGFSYVPIDPCQGVIAAIRTAIGERIPRDFIDMETPHFEAQHATFPDPYALKKVRPEAFAAAILPGISPPLPASMPSGLPGWAPAFASWNGGIARPCSSAPCWTGRGFATPIFNGPTSNAPTRSMPRWKRSTSTRRRSSSSWASSRS